MKHETCPADMLEEFVRRGYNYRNYDEYQTGKNTKKLIRLLYVIMVSLAMFMAFILGIVYERYNGMSNFLKEYRDSPIKFNKEQYRLKKNHRFYI